MSLPPDPDEPTRRLPPTHPSDVPPRAGYEREVVAAPEEDLYWREALLDRLRSLRTAVVLLGILAVAALGVALWALLSEDREGDGGRGASTERVSDLEDRVDDLQREVRRAPSRDDVSQLSDDVESLDERVGTLEDSVEQQQDGGAGASEQVVEDLQADVQQLGEVVQDVERRLDELEQQQDGAP